MRCLNRAHVVSSNSTRPILVIVGITVDVRLVRGSVVRGRRLSHRIIAEAMGSGLGLSDMIIVEVPR